MFNLKHNCLAAVAVLAASLSAAHAERLICEFAEGAAGGWAGPVMVLDVTDGGEVTVVDANIMHFNEEPMRARLRTNNARRLTVTWDLEAHDPSGNRSRMRYSAFIERPSLRASVQITPRGFRAMPRVSGQCRQEN